MSRNWLFIISGLGLAFAVLAAAAIGQSGGVKTTPPHPVIHAATFGPAGTPLTPAPKAGR